MSHLVDIDSVPVIDVWGETVRARRVQGERITFALVELAPSSVVPGHTHQAEQLGMVVTGAITFTIGDEVRDLGPGGTWNIPSNVYHQVNVGPEGALVIDVFTPIRSDWDGLPVNEPSSPRWPGR